MLSEYIDFVDEIKARTYVPNPWVCDINREKVVKEHAFKLKLFRHRKKSRQIVTVYDVVDIMKCTNKEILEHHANSQTEWIRLTQKLIKDGTLKEIPIYDHLNWPKAIYSTTEIETKEVKYLFMNSHNRGNRVKRSMPIDQFEKNYTYLQEINEAISI